VKGRWLAYFLTGAIVMSLVGCVLGTLSSVNQMVRASYRERGKRSSTHSETAFHANHEIRQVMEDPSFQDLDRRQGLSGDLGPLEFPSGLVLWYHRIYEVPVGRFTVDDLARAVLQDCHLDYILPLALRELEKNPLAGEFYDGELLCSLLGRPPYEWKSRPDYLRRVLEIVRRKEAQLRPELESVDAWRFVARLRADYPDFNA
jgi:hypothetical protein